MKIDLSQDVIFKMFYSSSSQGLEREINDFIKVNKSYRNNVIILDSKSYYDKYHNHHILSMYYSVNYES